MIYTIKLSNKTIHNVRSEKKNVCVQIIYYIKDTIYRFLITYLLLDTINFSRSRICLSEGVKRLRIMKVVNPRVVYYGLDEDLNATWGSLVGLVVLE
jgi:hypothetical protein